MARPDAAWRARKRAQLTRMMALVPNISVSVVNDNLFIVHFSMEDGEEAVEIGRPDREAARFRNNDPTQPYTITIPGVDIDDTLIEVIARRWSEGKSAADIAGVRRVRDEVA